MVKRRLLVTGGAGFIGANFVHYWFGRHPGDRLVVIDVLSYAGNRSNLSAADGNPNFRFVHGDIVDQALIESLLEQESIDTIVHFAAESHVDRSIVGPDPFVATNIIGTHSLLKAARRLWLAQATSTKACRFHHVSTDEVYGSLSSADPAFTENTPYAPRSPYAASKAAADHLVQAYGHTYGLPFTITNCSNNYGPYQFPEKLIPLMIVNALNGESLPIYGDGRNVRDWLFVEDHCRGIELVLTRGNPGETYNIGGNSERTNIDLVRQLCALVDRSFADDPELKARFPHCPAATGVATTELITFVTDRPGHDRRYAIDDAKIAAAFGYRPQYRLENGLVKTLEWYLKNEPWWRGVMNGSYRQWIDTQYVKRT
jgi:dTDP-glucose 4,6-dehydratase